MAVVLLFLSFGCLLMVGISILLRKRHKLVDKSLAIVSMLCATISVGSAIAAEYVLGDSMMKGSLMLLTAFLVTLAVFIDDNYCADVIWLVFDKYLSRFLPKTAYSTRDMKIVTICGRFVRVAGFALSFLFFTGFILMIFLNKR
jgi:hypothetical protein